MSLKGQLCIYCQESPSTRQGDHVVARGLLSIVGRQNAPKVPCCKSCNDAKSKLEHYLSFTLPLASRETDARTRLDSAIISFEQNQKLKRIVFQGIERVRNVDGTDGDETFAFPFEHEVLRSYAEFLAKGVLYWTKGVRVGSEMVINATFVPIAEDLELLWKIFHKTPVLKKLTGNIGGTTLNFESALVSEFPLYWVCRFTFANGAIFSDIEIGTSTKAIWVVVEETNLNSVMPI